MDPRNYRLGNLLREVKTGKIVEVIGLTKELEERITPIDMPSEYYDKYSLEVSGNFEGEWQAEEIPITKDILIKLGFYGGDKVLGKRDSPFIFKPHPNPVRHEIMMCFIFGFSIPNIKYLHEFQNLTHLLTGEHLDVSALNPEPIPQP